MLLDNGITKIVSLFIHLYWDYNNMIIYVFYISGNKYSK